VEALGKTRELSKLVAGLGWPVGTLGRSGGDLIDLVDRAFAGGAPAADGALRALEEKATEVVTFDPMLVPSPLRTPAYARALDSPLEQAERTFFLHEAALHVVVGDERIMAEQLRCLSRTPRVRLVPFTAGHHPEFRNAFTLLTLPHGDQVHIESVAMNVLSDRPDVVAAYRTAVRTLDRLALGERESRAEFAKRADRCDRPRNRFWRRGEER
jgi:hypothetical protein